MMSLLSRADSAVLAWHQDVVDFVQRSPLWFARLCLAAMAACFAARVVFFDPPPWVPAFDVLVLVMLARDCRSSLSLVIAGAIGFLRHALLVLVSIDVAASLLAPSPARATSLLWSLLLLAFFYFAACRPPRPRPPRGRLSLSGARP